MSDAEAAGEVRAAGGVPWRRTPSGRVEVLVVHRQRYDDWSFPKGKLDPGETWEQAAVREVWEEAAVVPVLGPELAETQYRDRNGAPKRVRYWSMLVAADAGFTAGDEVGERRWVDVEEVAGLLSYDLDRRVLAAFTATLPETGGSPASTG